MDIIVEPDLIMETCRAWRGQNLQVGLVPTMGFFHQGHVSLMKWARDNADRVVVSLFVNPTQFGPAEDLGSYPRDLDRDADMAAAAGVDVIFAPEAAAMYRPGHSTWIEATGPQQGLCGDRRPQHFRGVATVVAKLLNLVGPDKAVFGEKDWQQLAVIKQMVADLNFPVHIEGRPIVREEDGLALSSRNIYLTGEERVQAPHIYKGLGLIRDRVAQGLTETRVLEAELRAYYEQHIPLGRVDYIEFVDSRSMGKRETVQSCTLLAVAVFLGKARLIDNILLA